MGAVPKESEEAIRLPVAGKLVTGGFELPEVGSRSQNQAL